MKGRIDGTEVYLSESQLPEFTASINDILDPSSIKGTRSTTIRVIRTPEAARAVGSEYMAEQPRNDRPTLRIGDDSVDLFSATVVPVSRNRNEVELIAVGGNASWFEYAKTKRIRDHAWGDTDQISTAMQVASWTDLDALVYYALMDFGAITHPPSSNVISDNLRPAFRAHRVIGDLMAAQGWKVKPMGQLADHWKRLPVIDPDAKFVIPIPSAIAWQQLADGSGTAPNGFYFVPGADGTMDVDVDDVTFTIDDPTSAEFDGVEFLVVVYDFTDKLIVAQQSIGSRFFGEPDYATRVINATFTGIEVVDGHQYYVGIQAVALDNQERTITVLAGYEDNIPPTPDVLLASITYDLNSGAQVLSITRDTDSTLELTDQESEGVIYSVGSRLRIAKMMPDWTLIKLMTGLSNALCLAWVTNDASKTVEVWYDREYFRKPSRSVTTRDWTDRLDITEAPEQIEPSKPRVLEFKWASDDADALLRRHTRAIGAPYGSARIEIDNAYGNERTIDIPFAPTAMASGVNGLFIPVARQFDSTEVGSVYKRTVRLLVDGGMVSGSWLLNGASQTQYPLAYFAYDQADIVLPTDNVNVYGINEPVSVNTNWKRRLDELRYARVLECSVMLRDHEIRDFDHGMPTLLDDGSGPRWYYVQEIQGHRFGRREPTRVRLVEIPGAQLATRPLVNMVPVEYPVAATFQCVGEGYGSFVCNGGYVLVNYTITTTGFATIRRPDGETFTIADGDTLDFEGLTGTMCIWASNSGGEKTGDLLQLELNGGFDSADVSGLDQLLAVSVISAEMTDANAEGLNQCISFIFGASALTADSVDALFNAINLELNSGTVEVNGGTNAAPTAASAEARDILENGRNLTVSGAGTALANGEYELIGTANGRNSYDKVGGGPNISWDGTKWVLATTSGSYKAEQDVAEPWLATNWTTFGASAPAPSLTQPYPGGWTILTN